MIAGVLKESKHENRVALLPAEVSALVKLGLEVLIEEGAGQRAFASDDSYRSAGATTASRRKVISASDLILTVNPPVDDEISYFREGQLLFTLLDPMVNHHWIERARVRRLTVLALDLVPRTTRAQSADVLSSMATVSGYKAVLEAATLLPRFFPMFMSAAGTIRPARLLVLGAGVAGLQAVATARKLGAVVEVFDVRSAVKEEVRSLGGRFIEVEGAREDVSAGGYAVEQTEEFRQRQQQLIQERAAASDVIVATAQIPGRRAPLLVEASTVGKMRPGSVIIDLAAATGGNCELTEEGKSVVVNGVTIAGRSSYPSEMAADASKMFGNNLVSLIKMMNDGKANFRVDLSDEVIAGTVAIQGGEYISQRLKQMLDIK